MLNARERTALGIAVAAVLAAIVAASIASDVESKRLFDNVHWTISFATAAWLAWLGALRAPAHELAPRRMFAVALTAYAFGQVLWDVQIATGWNPFPAPSDAFYVLLGPITALGLFGFLRREASASQRRQVALDVAGLTTAVLALTLALYLPKRTNEAPLQLVVMVAYPVMLCWAACVGVVSALRLALAPRLGAVLFLGALFAQAFLWLRWNALTLDQALSDGALLNAGFSLTALAQGAGALLWRVDASTSERWQRGCATTLRLLPLFVVCVGALTAVLSQALPGVPESVQWFTWIGGAAVVLLAMLRQSILLAEHEDLIRTERTLRETEQAYRVLFDQATEGIFIADHDGRYLDVNPRGAEMMQRSREEILSLTIADLVAPEERGRVSGAVADLGGGATLNRPWRFMRKDQSTFPAEVSAKILPNGRILGTVRDISDRIALEAQLRQAQKMEAVGTLAAGIAHDFNNLIAAIAGNAELAAMDVESRERTATSLREIRAASTRAAELVRQIVAFSRPREPVAEIVQLGPAITEVASLLRSTLPAGIELNVTTREDTPAVHADASQLHQVLVNLATNAWQAMEGRSGTIAMHVELTQLPESNALHLEAGPYALIEVADDGKGMDAGTCERIFEPFFTTKDVGQGTGLGLAIVHRIVQAHRGAITVESELGRGTKFRIFLPAAAPAASAPAPRAPSPRPPLPHHARILYVDDEKALVSMISRHLEREGHRVRGFTSSTSALEAMLAAPYEFDVLVTDYNMPKLSGLDLLGKIKALRPDLPFILTSGSLDAELKGRATAMGIRWVLQKPYALTDLEHAIADLVGRLDAANATRSANAPTATLQQPD